MVNDIVGKLVADKYRVETVIAEGDLGDLCEGRHEIMDRAVTMKILPLALAVDDRWVKRFINEARSASSISHPNVLNITDFGTDAKNVTYAVYESFDGRSLRALMSEEPMLEELRALSIARQIAAPVAAAHAKGAIHGSLNPDKVLVDTRDEGDFVKVMGFGADTMDVASDTAPQYLAPEQCSAFPTADERSDVYSLGVMLYEMLAGVVPYDGATAAEVMAKQNTEPFAPLSAFRRDAHPEIEPIVITAIAAAPERRYQTMSAFAEDLETLSARVGTPKASAAATAGEASTRKVWQTAVLALAGISLLAAALIYATSVRKTDPTVQLQADAGSLPVQPIGPATGAQEESLARLPAMTDAEIMALANSNTMPMSDLPGGDGYNAWASGGVPPPGAPLQQQYVPPGGQYYTVDPSQGSQFMPQDGGVILVPVPVNTNTATKPEASPKTPPANANVSTKPETVPTPKPMATPPPKSPPAANAAPKKGKANTKPGEELP